MSNPPGPKGQIFKHITTDYDNITFDTGRFIVVVLAGLVIFTVMLLSAIAVVTVFWENKSFDFQSFGIGVASIFGGFATLLGAFAAYVAMDTRKSQGHEMTVLPAPVVTYPTPIQPYSNVSQYVNPTILQNQFPGSTQQEEVSSENQVLGSEQPKKRVVIARKKK